MNITVDMVGMLNIFKNLLNKNILINLNDLYEVTKTRFTK